MGNAGVGERQRKRAENPTWKERQLYNAALDAGFIRLKLKHEIEWEDDRSLWFDLAVWDDTGKWLFDLDDRTGYSGLTSNQKRIAEDKKVWLSIYKIPYKEIPREENRQGMTILIKQFTGRL